MHWSLDPDITFLNHGSFGACPDPILEEQDRWRRLLEREPLAFFLREWEPALDRARSALAGFLDAPGDDLVFVNNATTGVNAVMRSLHFEPGDEILTTNHAYNACKNTLQLVAGQSGARVVVADVPFPIGDAEQSVAAILSRVGERTRIAMVDHITSPTALVLPIQRIVDGLRQRGVATLVDGAHAPGQVELSIRALDADYYTGNCHKWLCTPKGSGFLYVRGSLQDQIRPTVTSHGSNSPRTDRSRFQLEFDWPGTHDPTPLLSIPKALGFMESLVPGGFAALRTRNRQKALEGRAILCDALGIAAPCPDSMVGSMASVPVADAACGDRPDPMAIDPLQDWLYREHRIEVPVMTWPKAPKRLLRISAQFYNDVSQYRRLADALRGAPFGTL